MDENNDFVIETGKPVILPVTEEKNTEAIVDSPNNGDDVLQSEEPAQSQPSEEIPAAKEEMSSAVDVAEEHIGTPDPSLLDIVTQIVALEKKFDEKIAVDEYKNSLFDKLYKERDEYKNDIYGKLLKPFVTGALNIVNDLRMYISKMDTFEVERSLNYLRSIPDDLIELLENNGVEQYEDTGEQFNPRTQRAKKIVDTDDISLNNKIAERIEKGFRWNESILRPEMVAVYKSKQQ